MGTVNSPDEEPDLNERFQMTPDNLDDDEEYFTFGSEVHRKIMQELFPDAQPMPLKQQRLFCTKCGYRDDRWWAEFCPQCGKRLV